MNGTPLSVTGTVIRLAKEDDEPAVFDLLRLMHAENPIGSLNEVKVAQTIVSVREGGVLIVAEAKREIVAAVGLIIQGWWWSDDRSMQDRFFFIHPNYRRGHLFDELCDYANQAAREFGLPLYLGVFSMEDIEAKTRLYGRHMRHIGSLFVSGM